MCVISFIPISILFYGRVERFVAAFTTTVPTTATTTFDLLTRQDACNHLVSNDINLTIKYIYRLKYVLVLYDYVFFEEKLVRNNHLESGDPVNLTWDTYQPNQFNTNSK